MLASSQQGHGTGDPQRIHDGDLPFRILLQQLFPGGSRGLQRAAELAGEGDEQDVLPLLQDGLEVVQVRRFIQRGSHRVRTGAHRVVIALVIQRLAEIIEVFLAVERIGHIDNRNIILLLQVIGQVTVAVGDENVIHCHGTTSFRSLKFNGSILYQKL